MMMIKKDENNTDILRLRSHQLTLQNVLKGLKISLSEADLKVSVKPQDEKDLISYAIANIFPRPFVSTLSFETLIYLRKCLSFTIHHKPDV